MVGSGQRWDLGTARIRHSSQTCRQGKKHHGHGKSRWGGHPLISENRIYLVKSLGIISCLNTETGKPFFTGKRTGVKGEYFSSPVKVGDKIVITSSLGSIFLIKDSEEFELLAHNKIDEEIVSTPAIVDDVIYLRSRDSLWAFTKETE